MNSPVSIRIPAAGLELIDRAATIDQRRRTEFMRATSLNAARDVLPSRKLLQSNAQAFGHFAATMKGPAVVWPEMLTIFRSHAPWKEACVPPQGLARHKLPSRGRSIGGCALTLWPTRKPTTRRS